MTFLRILIVLNVWFHRGNWARVWLWIRWLREIRRWLFPMLSSLHRHALLMHRPVSEAVRRCWLNRYWVHLSILMTNEDTSRDSWTRSLLCHSPSSWSLNGVQQHTCFNFEDLKAPDSVIFPWIWTTITLVNRECSDDDRTQNLVIPALMGTSRDSSRGVCNIELLKSIKIYNLVVKSEGFKTVGKHFCCLTQNKFLTDDWQVAKIRNCQMASSRVMLTGTSLVGGTISGIDAEGEKRPRKSERAESEQTHCESIKSLNLSHIWPDLLQFESNFLILT